MADTPDDPPDSVDEALQGWGAPPPRPQFADDVLCRVRTAEPRRSARPGTRLGWILALSAGAIAGGLVASTAPTVRCTPSGEPGGVLEGPGHARLWGAVDVVAQSGARVRWRTNPSGDVALDVIDGVVWVRIEPNERGIEAYHDDDVIEPGACERIEVTSRFLGESTNASVVDCDRIDTAIDAVQLEGRGRP